MKSYTFCIFITIVVVMYFSISSFALVPEDYNIQGVVVDSVSGQPVSYVTVSIQNTDGIVKQLACNEKGEFNVQVETPGSYDVIFHSVGYQVRKVEVKVNEETSEAKMGSIRLIPSNEEIAEVTVAVQKPLIRTEPDKIIYSIETDPESKTSNVLEMLRKVPLITVDGEDNIQMKGSSNFKILINGKSSAMMSQNPKDVLRSLPASSVRDIEVITDPSTKYEAEGTAGIINIITNKKQLEGLMGRVNAGVDSRGGYNGGLYASSKINKFGFSLNYGHYRSLQPKNLSYSTRENLVSDNSRLTETEGSNKYSGRMNYLMGEASYEIDSLNLISMSYSGFFGNYTGTGLTVSSDYDINNHLVRQFENNISTGNEYGSVTGNIDYQRTFKKPDQTFTLSYRLDKSPRDTENGNSINGILNYPSYQQKTINEAAGLEHTVQVDYYDPISKTHQIETGLKYILRQNTSESDIQMLNELGNWERDLSRINDLDYNQYILGVYAGYVVKFKKFNIKTGARFESTKNDGVFKSQKDTTFTNRFYNLIPYINLSKNMDKGQNLRLSYTQRLSRPGIWYLNPFYNDTDPLNVRFGNPELDAEVTHSFSFAYGKFTPAINFNLNLNSSFTNNAIVSITKLQPNGVSESTYENIGKNRNYGGNIYGSVKIGKKINLNTNLGLNYVVMESNNDLNLENKGAVYNGSLSVRYTVWKNGTFSLFGGAYSPRIMLQGSSSSFTYSNISFSQQLFDKKLMVSVAVNDPFRERMTFSNKMSDPTFTMVSKNYIYNRMFRFSISYQFGKLSEQIKKAKRTISNEDLKSGGDNQQGGTTQPGN